MKCDRCDQSATVHLIEIHNGQKIEKHLCEHHAEEENVSVKVNPPINELLEKFVTKHTGQAADQVHLICDDCGLNYDAFRRDGLLGCPGCYDNFEDAIEPLIARAHEGAVSHFGKVPSYAGSDQLQHQRLLRLRQELQKAVMSEQFERAAQLRDEVQQLESEV